MIHGGRMVYSNHATSTDWLEQLGQGGRLVRAIGSWWPIDKSIWVVAANWLQQLGHVGRLASALGWYCGQQSFDPPP